MAEDWQINMTLSQCNEYLLDHQVACDITFRVGPENEQHDIGAHKTLLLSRSPVFFAMFCGELKEKGDVIAIPDSTLEPFREMLRFIYTDHSNLTMENVFDVVYLSKKYLLMGLQVQCATYLEGNLQSENAAYVFEKAHCFEMKDTALKCKSFIKESLIKVMKSDAFLDISRETLGFILEIDSGTNSVLEMFQSCRSWAQAECKRQNLPSDPGNERKVLGEHLFKLHLPDLALGQFADHVVTSGVLTHEESLSVFMYHATAKSGKYDLFPVKVKRNCLLEKEKEETYKSSFQRVVMQYDRVRATLKSHFQTPCYAESSQSGYNPTKSRVTTFYLEEAIDDMKASVIKIKSPNI